MTFPLEYHVLVKSSVRRSISSALALLGMLLFPLFFVSSSPAQIGAASSGGGHSFSGGAAGVTSHGHTSVAPPTGAFAPATAGFTPPTSGINSHNHGFSNVNHHRHHAAGGDIYYPYYPYAYGVPVPYAADANDSDSDDDDSEYQGGPTIFDRRGSGAASYIPPSYPGPAHQAAQSADARPDGDSPSQSIAAAAPEPPQPPTTLVFKDGHQLEIANYAIVGPMLYDLTPGRPRKIALADLDIPATEKQNDDNGVPFALPPSAQAN